MREGTRVHVYTKIVV